MSTYLTQGIVLRRSHYNDYDRQYVIYTRELGKISAVAKGVKRITSKLGSHLEPLFLANLMIANGLFFERIAGAQLIKRYPSLRNDLNKIIIASYFLEAVDVLMKYDFKDEAVFEIVDNFLSKISSPARGGEAHSGAKATRMGRGGGREKLEEKAKNLIYLNKFLFDLLSHLGYCPILRAKTQRELLQELNNLILEVGEKEIKSFNLLTQILA